MVENSVINDGCTAGPNISVAINTLVAGGHLLQKAARNPGYILIHTSYYDEFGMALKYCFLISEDRLTEEQIQGAKIAANHEDENLVLVGRGEIEHPHIEWDRFINLFGGPVISTSPLEPEFDKNLEILAHNKLPPLLVGKADDLFEIYVHVALEFILGGRVVRYGQARLFEKKPDGLAMPSPYFRGLYDAKAYSGGYKVTSNTIIKFASYIDEFNATYSSWYRLNSFILVSGEFPHNTRTLERRSRELLAKSGVPLSFLTANTLGKIVNIMKQMPLFRRSIDWTSIFTTTIVNTNDIQNQINTILRDRVVKI